MPTHPHPTIAYHQCTQCQYGEEVHICQACGCYFCRRCGHRNVCIAMPDAIADQPQIAAAKPLTRRRRSAGAAEPPRGTHRVAIERPADFDDDIRIQPPY